MGGLNMKLSEFLWCDILNDEEMDFNIKPYNSLFVTNITVDEALKFVTGFTVEDLQNKSKNRDLVEPRQLGMAFYHFAGHNLKQSGLRFHRDHATVLHSIRKLKTLYGRRGEEKLTAMINNMSLFTEINFKP